MSYPYIIIPDMEEGHEVNEKLIRVAYNDGQIQDAIRAISSLNPNTAICVYRLHEVHKLKTKPTYAKYAVNDKFEIAPV